MPLRALVLPALLVVATAASAQQEPAPTYAPPGEAVPVPGEALPVPTIEVSPLAADPEVVPLPTFGESEGDLPAVSPTPSPAGADVEPDPVDAIIEAFSSELPSAAVGEPEGTLPDASPTPSPAGAAAESDVIDPISETPPRAAVAGSTSLPGEARRRDAAPPAMPPSLGLVRGSGGSSGTSGAPLDVSGCPRALVRGRLAAAAADGDDPIVALGVETALLRLCADRQEVVTALLEGERELRALRDGATVASGQRAVEIVEQLLAPPEPVETPTAAAAPVTALEPVAEPPPPPPPPEYGWFSIIGGAGQLTAGVTDGDGVWWVGAGDALPGGVRVSAVAGRPAAVTVAGALSGALPYRSPP